MLGLDILKSIIWFTCEYFWELDCKHICFFCSLSVTITGSPFPSKCVSVPTVSTLSFLLLTYFQELFRIGFWTVSDIPLYLLFQFSRSIPDNISISLLYFRLTPSSLVSVQRDHSRCFLWISSLSSWLMGWFHFFFFSNYCIMGWTVSFTK